MLPERNGEGLREVDVVIRSTVAGHQVVVSLECREQARKASVEWVDEMSSKHSTLPTSKLILLSSSGFSSGAERRAASLGIDTYTFDAALQEDWVAVLGAGPGAPMELWAIRPLRCFVFLKGHDRPYLANPGTQVFDRFGTEASDLGTVVEAVVDESGKFVQTALEFSREQKQSVVGADLKRTSPTFLRDDAGQLHEIEIMRLILEVVPAPEDVRLSQARYRGRPVAYAQGPSPAGQYTLSLMQTEEGSATGAISIVDAETGEVATAEVCFPGGDGELKFFSKLVGLRRRPGAI